MSKSVVAGFCLSLSLAAFALANDAPPSSSTQEAASESSTKSVASEASAEPRKAAEPAAATTAVAATDAEVSDDPIVCKRVEVTGTRLRKGKVCKPKSEWRQMSDDAQATMKDVDRKSSPGPGGQTLPPGG